MFVIKANRQYKITEDEKQRFIDMGYRIAELKNGKLVLQEIETKESKEITKLMKENETLKKEIEVLKNKNGEGK